MPIKSRSLLYVFLLLLFCLSALDGFSQSRAKPHYYFHGYGYGSDALVHPLRLIINGGYGIMQMENVANDVTLVDYETGYKNVWDNLRHPLKAIRHRGTREFLLTEVFPATLNHKKAYYWPNYSLHLLGGGMSFRMMEEWFRHRDLPWPRIQALATITAYHLLNEVVENSGYVGYNTDAIADIYIFNPIGILLFSYEGVARFFSETFNLADWSAQTAYNPSTRSLVNNGQNFVMKYWLTQKENVGLFYHFGTHGEFGLSFKRQDQSCLSIGMGVVANKLKNLSKEQTARQLSADFVWTAGLFYDRNNSLLFSLIYSQSKDYKLRVNLYPGVLRVKSISPGLYFVLNQFNEPNIGVAFSFFPVGLSRHF
jgi:hypothetical protein